MRVLVTGGAGFIGSHLVDDLVREGHEVTVYDDFSTGYDENLAQAGERVRIIVGDVLDRDDLINVTLAGRFDVVSHHAAQLEILRAMDDPVDDLKTNTIGTLNVLEACRRGHVPRVIIASSAGVYGQAQYTPQDEAHPLEPQWAYGVSKLACEHYARQYQQDHGLQVTCLRYGLVYGPREWYGRVLSLFLGRLAAGERPVVFGDGLQVRDWIHVQDVVAFNRLCLASKETVGQVFNVASGKGYTVKELAELCVAVTGLRDLPPLHEQLAEGATSVYVDRRRRIPHELQCLVQHIGKATLCTGWVPQIGLREGLLSQWQWLRQDNQWRYDVNFMRV